MKWPWSKQKNEYCIDDLSDRRFNPVLSERGISRFGVTGYYVRNAQGGKDLTVVIRFMIGTPNAVDISLYADQAEELIEALNTVTFVVGSHPPKRIAVITGEFLEVTSGDAGSGGPPAPRIELVGQSLVAWLKPREGPCIPEYGERRIPLPVDYVEALQLSNLVGQIVGYSPLEATLAKIRNLRRDRK
jgi:hypothetical protein